MLSSKIAVIGAGMAGITAARSLKAAGHRVQVFEKSRGSGGRLASKRSEMGRINLGAQRFTSDDPLFLAELHMWQQAGWVQQHNNAGKSHWAGMPYMSALTRNLLSEIDTLFACEIHTLSYHSDGWLLHDQHQQRHGPFQQLIVAIPAAQASTLLSSCAPQIAQQAAKIEIQPIWMVALGFKQPLAQPESFELFNNAVISEVTHTPLSTEQPMHSWTLRSSVKWSIEHLEKDHQYVIQALRAAFASLLGRPLPEHDSAFAHRWRYALGARQQPAALLSDPQRGLYIAGDWCGDGDVYSAWHSGKQAAQQLLERIAQG